MHYARLPRRSMPNAVQCGSKFWHWSQCTSIPIIADQCYGDQRGFLDRTDRDSPEYGNMNNWTNNLSLGKKIRQITVLVQYVYFVLITLWDQLLNKITAYKFMPKHMIGMCILWWFISFEILRGWRNGKLKLEFLGRGPKRKIIHQGADLFHLRSWRGFRMEN